MKSSPLQLKQIVNRRFTIEAKPGPKFGANTTVNVEHTFRRNDVETNKWVVALTVEFKSLEPLPLHYEGLVELVGQFEVDNGLAEEKHLLIVATTCPSILYSAAREMVTNFSARGPNGTFLLPTVSFVDLRLETIKPAEPAAAPST
jgi:preprotein translocase subunit SecB